MTKRRLPSGVIALSPGEMPTGMLAVFVRATVSRTETLAESMLLTKALRRSGVVAIRIGVSPTGIWVTIWLVAVSITATSSEYLAGQKRERWRVGDICADWAKADEATAKAKIINSKGGRYVFIRKWIKADVRQSTANGQF